MVNFNSLSDPVVRKLYDNVVAFNETVLSPELPVRFLFDHAFDENEKHLADVPHAYIAEPVWDSFEEDRNMVGFMVALTSWANYFNNILPPGADGIICVVRDSCGSVMTWELRGPTPHFVGNSDTHDISYEKYGRTASIEKIPEGVSEDYCYHELTIFPSDEFRKSYNNNKDIIYTSVVAVSFLFTFAIFAVYDILTNQRQRKTMEAAIRTNRIVSSLFPAAVRARLIEGQSDTANSSSETSKGKNTSTTTDGDDKATAAPIADLFPEATIMFAE